MYPTLALAMTLALFSGEAQARSPEAAEQLGTTLTPLGGQLEGNAAGTIPPWQGGLTMAPAGYERSGQHHVDPFASDEPLFTIDASNLEEYRGQLTPGQQALFAAYPGTFRMPVFVSRRSASAPESVYEHTRVNAQSAQLREGGNGFIGAYGGIPFPLPRNGVEAVWNHITRYRGTYLTRRSAEVAVQRNGGYVPIVTEQQALFRYYDPRVSAAGLDNRLFYYLTQTRSPARLAGGAILVHETLDQYHEPRQAWAYNSGQRRVRRAPSLAYDTPIAAADGLRTADDTDMYNGSPDRYEWKLLGKQEIYIPYNNYRLGNPQITYKQLLTPSHLNPEYTRYELHRVWVVEGTLKKDARHVYSKRRLYLDEDSWQAAVVDQYDGRGDLWRVSMAYLKNYYELPTVWSALDVYHDLQARRYHVQNLDNEEVATVDFSQPLPDAGDFTPAALRRQGTR
ncbi:DUF1329 domain-containing protein [Pseudomonas sp. HR96]|uniref:DUF1329 domain-containing protein n=1 Tax=Pseudomonas sp. HR96 TaxID=1027966 RepID=UPI002A766802|nr:DUF1329 domain-containing protein [Pseudomonas sp. HR96]WPO98667.1 DUF1329 domain-containing protein [Pseudomonas sp. HR96]